MLSKVGDLTADINRARRSFFGAVNMIIRRFCTFSLQVKQQLFRAYCYSLYGAFLWSGHPKNVFDLLRVGVDSAIKRLLGKSKYDSTRLSCLKMDILPVEGLSLSRRLMFLKRALFSVNPVVQAAVHGTKLPASSFLRETSDLLVPEDLSHLNFVNCCSVDLHNLFMWNILRSLEIRPVYIPQDRPVFSNV